MAADYDLIIVGAGPGGLTAALYAGRAKMKVLLLEKAVPGGQVIVTDWIENYPGFPDGIGGFDLGEKMKAHALKFGAEMETAEVKSVDFSRKEKAIKLADKTITAKSVILAPGASPRGLNVGEEKFVGKGVSFCGTCDAPFFKGKTVVAVGGGDTAVQESIYLSKFAEKVYLVHRRDELRATKILQERAFANEKIEFVWDSVVKGMDGLFSVENVIVENVKTSENRKIAANGCFIWVGILPNTAFLADSVELDEGGFIVTDSNMATSAQGVFAVGDARVTPLRQVGTAVGDGSIAAISAEHYIENM
jgi:thioredoxin reductase (NADPH)